MASLLSHGDLVPRSVRDALQAAQDATCARRIDLLESAARILQREMGVTCPDARELVDLQLAGCPG
jgi:hypothetical protein